MKVPPWQGTSITHSRATVDSVFTGGRGTDRAAHTRSLEQERANRGAAEPPVCIHVDFNPFALPVCEDRPTKADCQGLTKRLLLLFLGVMALPKASIMGLACVTVSSESLVTESAHQNDSFLDVVRLFGTVGYLRRDE